MAVTNRQQAVASATSEVHELSPYLGAAIRCGDVRQLGDAGVDAIRRRILEHLVVVIRGQDLTDPELIAFGSRLGELDVAPYGYTYDQKERPHDEVIVVSNVREDGKPIGVLGDAEVVWHSDNSYRETPLSMSLLYGVEVPAAGGETGFLNMYLAHDMLPAYLRRTVQSLVIKHDITYNSAGELRRGFDHVSDPVKAPGPHHPIIRTHPETGYDTLYLGRRPNAYVCGYSPAESESLLNTLWSHATREAFAFRHAWQRGDIVIWDNRCVMHHRTPFDASARRIMHRLQFKGGRPMFDPGSATRGRHPRATAVRI